MSLNNVMEAIKHTYILIGELLFLRTAKYRTKAIITNNNFTRVPHAYCKSLLLDTEFSITLAHWWFMVDAGVVILPVCRLRPLPVTWCFVYITWPWHRPFPVTWCFVDIMWHWPRPLSVTWCFVYRMGPWPRQLQGTWCKHDQLMPDSLALTAILKWPPWWEIWK
jgi:hypothetical protein